MKKMRMGWTALDAAVRCGWVPTGTWLRVVADLDELAKGPLICAVNGHALCLLSARDGVVMYLDPRYEDAESMSAARLRKETGGFFYRVVPGGEWEKLKSHILKIKGGDDEEAKEWRDVGVGGGGDGGGAVERRGGDGVVVGAGSSVAVAGGEGRDGEVRGRGI